MKQRFFAGLVLVVLVFVSVPSAARDARASVPLTSAGVLTESTITPAGYAWYNGMSQYSTITNCASIIQNLPYQEKGVGTYVGFLADPDAGQPAPGSVYYLHVVIAGLGNSCSGMRAYVDLGLPSNTSLAIDSTNKLYCFYDNAQITPASDCPQTLPSSSYNQGMYDISAPASSSYTWPVPQGHILEFQIPVRSSTALTDSLFQAKVWILDGNSSPWLQPQQGVYVFSNQPSIVYPSPSTINITATSARSQAYLYTHGLAGDAYFDLGTDTSYSLIHYGPIPVAAGGNAHEAWIEWTPPPLQPDTLYHWRLSYVANGINYFGDDQTFRTLPDGQVTVGNGSSSSCTEAAFTSALTTAKRVVFDCGALPVTITLSSKQTIASDVTIDGGNKVTLSSGGAWSHFQVQAGAHLTITQITLANGTNNVDCGGSVTVAGSARLTLNGARFISNTAASKGGALCVKPGGYADVQDSLFLGNHSSSGGSIANDGTITLASSVFSNSLANPGHGGAIQNWGSLSVTDSQFTGNSAGINGGSIDTTVALTLTNSTFISNTAGVRGGAINNYVGTSIIAASSFISNTSRGYGGGIANDVGTVTVQTSSFLSNTAASVGGGVRNNGGMTVANSTFSANHATTHGGGVDNSSDDPANYQAILTITNSTLANNSAGAGGNLFKGSDGTSVTLKNTVVASGNPDNCNTVVTSQGNNLDSANSCGFVASGDLVNANPKLGPLQDNGGKTLTYALLTGSPAIDSGANTGCPATDQRGVARPIDGNGDGIATCDIGAFEAPALAVFKLYLPNVRH